MKQIMLQLRKTYLEKKKFRKSLYKYYNFWSIANPEEVWFSRFIEFHNLNPKKLNINFISLFGLRNMHSLISSPKIFYSGENIDKITFNKILPTVDLNLGFYHSPDPKNFYLPLWFLSFIEPDSTLESLTLKFNKFNDFSFRADGRNQFACQISRHDENGIRKKIISILQKTGSVDCAGTFMNNTNDLKEKYGDDKLAFLKSYKFNICPENSNTPGYVTEKIFDAIEAGCIPMYWSKENFDVLKVLNQNAILFYDDNNPEALLHKVCALEKDSELFVKFISQPIFNDDAAAIIINHLEKLKDKLKILIDSH